MLVNVPIESLKERYSAQWNEWIPEELDRLGVDYYTVDPKTIRDKIANGSFLDVTSTIKYKADQVSEIVGLVDRGVIGSNSVFLFHDGWFPIDLLAYIRDLMGYKWKFVCLFHAGTYDHNDLLARKGLDKWGQHLENSWFAIYDDIIVATRYHKDLISTKRYVDPNKIQVIQFPLHYKSFVDPKAKKENIVVFPHRLDPEKQPELFDSLAKDLEGYKGFRFIRTKDVWTTKKAYYDLLNSSKISISVALQETWGIAMLESLFCGCAPLVPNMISYSELYPKSCKYMTYWELKDKLAQLMNLLHDKPDTSVAFSKTGLKRIEILKTRSYEFTERLVKFLKRRYSI